MPDTVHLTPNNKLMGSCDDHHPHFADEKTEAERG